MTTPKGTSQKALAPISFTFPDIVSLSISSSSDAITNPPKPVTLSGMTISLSFVKYFIKTPSSITQPFPWL